MMVVVTITNCPAKLKGDLSRWFLEIDTGVFVSNLSARVRDNIWQRICDNIKTGKATMVYSTNREQKLDFKIHNTNWIPTDYDGLTLVKRKLEGNDTERRLMSKARINHRNRLKHNKTAMNEMVDEYVCIDIETTGLHEAAKIIELAAVHVSQNKIIDQYASYVKIVEDIPENIVALTGITNELLEAEGSPIEIVMKEFQLFCGHYPLVGHNILGFDIGFIQRESQSVGLQTMSNKLIDTMKLARKKIGTNSLMKLSSLAQYFDIEYSQTHRALSDCITTYRIYEKLKEI